MEHHRQRDRRRAQQKQWCQKTHRVSLIDPPAHQFAALHPLAQEIEQRQFQRTIRAHTAVTNAEPAARRLNVLVVRLQPLQVALAGGDRVNEKLAPDSTSRNITAFSNDNVNSAGSSR